MRLQSKAVGIDQLEEDTDEDIDDDWGFEANQSSDAGEDADGKSTISNDDEDDDAYLMILVCTEIDPQSLDPDDLDDDNIALVEALDDAFGYGILSALTEAGAVSLSLFLSKVQRKAAHQSCKEYQDILDCLLAERPLG